MKRYCFCAGKIMPLEDATVSVEDIGLLRGYGIYEGISTANHKPFRLDDHLDRFEKSAEMLGLKIPYSRKKIADILDELIKKHNFNRTNFRCILTGGKAEGGSSYNENTPTFYILAEEWKSLPSEIYTKGSSLVTFEHARTLPEIKTINYITAISLQPRRKKENAVEILFISKGKVLEAAMSNFFIIKGGTLITANKDILRGITRKVILELARGHFLIEERSLSLDEAMNADEAFITGSYKDIVPIVEIDGKKIATGNVGPHTEKIMKLFYDYARKF